MVGIFHHELFEKHLEGYQHPERPERVKVIMKRLRSFEPVDSLTFIEAAPAERAWIERIHDPGYVNGILSLEITDAVVLDWGDTVATPATPQAALHAAGAAVQASRMVLAGELASAFCPVRPPGHHAEHDRAMGFCLFNNIAIAAADLLEHGGLRRVAIVDWDVHHGNGTEKSFIEEARVLYVSLHQYPHYPGTGHERTVGTGPGAGYTMNVPMGAGAGDREYLDAFENRVIPALDSFKPEFILISAGFDAHGDDPLSGALLTTEAFGRMTEYLKAAAERHCGGKIVSLLEGGYDLDALADSVEAHLTVLAG
ncbi:MAG TPA: histone deacetylase [Patescibacteria group bacterium]|nr:histone deacetylase [Patescibacteria group bacterium]